MQPASPLNTRGLHRIPAEDDPHGRSADAPSQIPARGWKDIALRVKDAIVEDNVTTVAAGTTFFLLLSLVPMMSALVSIYGLFSDPQSVQSQLDMLADFVPEGGMEILREQLTRLVAQNNSNLGLAFAGSLLLTLWTANAGMKGIINALNVAYREREKRGFIALTLTSLAFTIGALLLFVVAISAVVVVPAVLNFIGFEGNPLVARVAPLAVLFVIAVFGISALYRWGPSRRSAMWRWVTPGAIVALIGAMLVSVLFSWYVSSFGSYNRTYGSLGALIGFMTWMWIMSTVMIVGAELNAEIEHQTARDSTSRRERPMGRRGARMADSIGPIAGGGYDPVATSLLAQAGGGHERDVKSDAMQTAGAELIDPREANARADSSPKR